MDNAVGLVYTWWSVECFGGFPVNIIKTASPCRFVCVCVWVCVGVRLCVRLCAYVFVCLCIYLRRQVKKSVKEAADQIQSALRAGKFNNGAEWSRAHS